MTKQFITIVDEVYFYGGVAAIKSLLFFNPEVEVSEITVVYLPKSYSKQEAYQVSFLKNLGVKVSLASEFIRASRVLGAWQLKTYAMSDLFDLADVSIQFDADILFVSEIQDQIERTHLLGSIRGGKDNNQHYGEKFLQSYEEYGNLPDKNYHYMSTSCWFAAKNPTNKMTIELASFFTDRAFYGKGPKKFRGHGDQGLLNVSMRLHGILPNLLPNQLWSQHDRTHDRINFNDKFQSFENEGEPMRTFHNKLWREVASEFEDVIWPYAAWDFFCDLGDDKNVKRLPDRTGVRAELTNKLRKIWKLTK